MGEGDRRCAARPPERPVQVHPDHHVVDGAVAVAEPVDGVEPVDEVAVLREQKKGYKNSGFPLIIQYPCVANVKTRCPLDGNANASGLDVDHGV